VVVADKRGGFLTSLGEVRLHDARTKTAWEQQRRPDPQPPREAVAKRERRWRREAVEAYVESVMT
jgi:hypothetical protein